MNPYDWKPVGHVSLEENAQKAVTATGNVLVVAGPGAGKTELLIQKADYLFKTNLCLYPKKILVLTFKKDACRTIKKRFSSIEDPSFADRFDVETYDAFSKSLLDRFRLALCDSLRPEKDYLVEEKEVIKAACFEIGIKRREYELWLNRPDKIVSDNGIYKKLWMILIKGFNGNKATLTFKMICSLAILIIKNNHKIRKALQLTYENVFLDEFQDTTELQYQLVKECFLNSTSKITAVGDPKQRIMLWAGAYKNVFSDFRKDFNSEEIELYINHRSTIDLLNFQYQFYSLVEDKSSIDKNNNKIACNSQNIKWYQFRDENEEAIAIAEDICHLKECGYKENEICILYRLNTKNNDSEKIIKALQEKGIYSRVEESYQSLRVETVVVILLSYIKLAIFDRSPNEWEDLIRLSIGINKISVYSDGEEYRRLINKIENKIKTINKMLPNIKSIDQLEQLLNDILNFVGIDRIIANYRQYQDGSYLKNILNKFLNLLFSEYERNQYDWRLAISAFEGLNSIPIMTIHKSKGLEFKVIYLIGLESETFFGLKNSNDMEKVKEELSVIFVGISRAKEKIIITTCSTRNGKNVNKMGTKMDDVFNILNQNAKKYKLNNI